VAEIILAIVTAQRGAELLLSWHNTKRLKARGAVEAAPGHYPLVVVLHASWLIALWALGRNQQIIWPLLAAYVALEGLRAWVMATLRERWTTRIIVLANAPLVTAGPYRYLRHPNYAVVVGEIALLPLALHLPRTAVAFTVLNGLMLLIRIRAENYALETSRRIATRETP
jgi:methyltransferase